LADGPLDQHQVILYKFIQFTAFILIKEFLWYAHFLNETTKSLTMYYSLGFLENIQGFAETLIADLKLGCYVLAGILLILMQRGVNFI
jgi:hypothetical protein